MISTGDKVTDRAETTVTVAYINYKGGGEVQLQVSENIVNIFSYANSEALLILSICG